MIEIVVMGPALLQVRQAEKLRGLREQCGLPPFDDSYTHNEIWERDDEAGILSGCLHLQLPVTLMMKDTKPEVLRFIVEAMKLAGVFLNNCPEHTKRREWEQRTPKIEEFLSAAAAPTA